MLLKANNLQRFCAFMIDFLLIGLAANLILALVYTISGYDVTVKDNILSQIMSIYNEVAGGNDANIEKFYSLFYEYMRYGGFELLISIPIYFVLDLLYLVILPHFWSKQTLGRVFMNCKVVKNNGNLSIGSLCLRELVGTLIFYQILGYLGIFISVIMIIASNCSIVDRISKTTLVTTRVFIINNNQEEHFNGFTNNFNENDINSNRFNQDDNLNDNQDIDANDGFDIQDNPVDSSQSDDDYRII